MTPIRFLEAFDEIPGFEPDVRWALLTAFLSTIVAVGYIVIAFNWFFQSKLARGPEARASLNRLRTLVACCGLFGLWFFASDMSWPAWRIYDVVLAGLAAHTWWFAVRMRGMCLLHERLAQADELERSAQRYREIAELLPHVVWTATAEGLVDFSNRRWIDYGACGRTWLDSVHPAEREEVLAWWDEVTRGRNASSREVRLDTVGGYRTFLVSASPIVHGESVKWLGACADVEDQKRMAVEKEAQARQKAFFLNSLSHDLRAPLNNVVLNAHLLKMTMHGESHIDCASAIMENAVAAGELVSSLLECAKPDGDDGADAELVSLTQLLHQVARRFRRISDQKGLDLRVLAGGDVEVLTDRQKLERVVANLLDNAIKFTERGTVSLELARPDDGVRIRISDTGIGVPEEDVPYLFDEFYQVDNHERDRKKGFGMGLAICRSLARQLGGDVRLEKTGPGGSCFEVSVGQVGPGSRRRPVSEEGRHTDPQDARLCGV